MDPAFRVHKLTPQGIEKAKEIAEAFDLCLTTLDGLIPSGRYRSLVVTKLEEASFFAKKAMAEANGEPE